MAQQFKSAQKKPASLDLREAGSAFYIGFICLYHFQFLNDDAGLVFAFGALQRTFDHDYIYVYSRPSFSPYWGQGIQKEALLMDTQMGLRSGLLDLM